MQTLQDLQISTVSLFEQQSILIQYNQEWYQENINQLTQCLMTKFTEIKELEVTTGADRAYIRFEYQKDFFTLQFECNSQSSWVEAEDERSREALPQLYSELKANIINS